MRIERRILISLLVLLAWSPAAWATYINPSGGGNGSETSLQKILDDRRSNPLTDSFNVTGDQLSPDAVWNIDGQQAFATIIIEIAGYANGNRFGIYDVNDPSKKVQIFGGAATTGANRTIQIVQGANGFDVKVNNSLKATFASQDFGFYLFTKVNQVFYSQSSLNPDTFQSNPASAEADHLVAFAGEAGRTLNIAGATKSWDANDTVLAWEDYLGGGDRDYNDMVLLVQNVKPTSVAVPDGGLTVVLLGVGLLLLGSARRLV